MGVFANTFTAAIGKEPRTTMNPLSAVRRSIGGWLSVRLQRSSQPPRRLAVIERVSLTPRQSLVMVEADSQRLLVAVSSEGAPVFYPLSTGVSGRGGHSKKKTEGKKA